MRAPVSEVAHRVVVRRTAPPIGRIGGAWKVAFADLATAMMALFLVLWLGNQDAAVRKAVAHYFQDPIAFDPQRASGRSPLGNAGTGDGPIDGLLAAPRTLPQPAARESLERAARALRRTLESLPSFQALGRLVSLDVSADGLRIELVDQEGSSFFERGGRALSREGEEVVRAIGRELAQLGAGVVVEGHSDGVPFRGEAGDSNWELSADRANGARRALEAGGLPPERIEAVEGYADRRLRFPESPTDPRNRRIAILVPSRRAPPEAARRPTPE